MYFALSYTVEVVFVYEPLYFALSYTVEVVFVYEPLVLGLSYTKTLFLVYEPLVFGLLYTKTPLLVYGTWLPGWEAPQLFKFFFIPLSRTKVCILRAEDTLKGKPVKVRNCARSCELLNGPV